jgi:hypothetical protein
VYEGTYVPLLSRRDDKQARYGVALGNGVVALTLNSLNKTEKMEVRKLVSMLIYLCECVCLSCGGGVFVCVCVHVCEWCV